MIFQGMAAAIRNGVLAALLLGATPLLSASQTDPAPAPAPAPDQLNAAATPDASAKLEVFSSFTSANAIEEPPAVEMQVLGGRRPDDMADWPATFIARGITNCTGSLVGPRVFLTAAHCVADNKEIELRISEDPKVDPWKARCHHPSDYGKPVLPVNDYAICDLTAPLDVPVYERINDAPQKVVVGAKVLITGFGCSAKDANDKFIGGGVFRIGDAIVFKLPTPTTNAIRAAGTGVACLGDSGGATYLADDSTKRRVLIGVQMASDVEKETETSSVTTAAALKFFEQLKTKEGGVCGATPGMTKKCRKPPWAAPA